MEHINFNNYAITLSKGAHDSPKQGMCIMECVAYIAGEQHTDHPECACPLVTMFAIGTNDVATEKQRKKLLPFVLRIAGSKATGEIERQRASMCADYAVRVFAAKALEVVGLHKESAQLRELPKIIAASYAARAAAASAAADARAAAASAAGIDAAANAAAAVYAANAAAAYAAAAAVAYAAAADADTYAARLAAYTDEIFKARLALLDDMLKLTEEQIEIPVAAKKLQELVEITVGQC